MAPLQRLASSYKAATGSSGCLSKGILPAQMFSVFVKTGGGMKKKSKLEHQKVLSLFSVRLCSRRPNWCLNWHSWCGFKTRCHTLWSKENSLTLIKSHHTRQTCGLSSACFWNTGSTGEFRVDLQRASYFYLFIYFLTYLLLRRTYVGQRTSSLAFSLGFDIYITEKDESSFFGQTV